MDTQPIEKARQDKLSFQKQPYSEEDQERDNIVIGASCAGLDNQWVEQPGGYVNHHAATLANRVFHLRGNKAPVYDSHHEIEQNKDHFAGKGVNAVVY